MARRDTLPSQCLLRRNRPDRKGTTITADTPTSSQPVGRTWIFDAASNTKKCNRSPAILGLGIRPCLVQPALEVLRRAPLSGREHGTCFGNLVRADVADREHEVWLSHLGLVSERPRLPTNGFGILLRTETRNAQQVVGLIT